MEKTNKLPKENKMGVMPMNKLVVSMSLPMVISMIVQALYNIVDSIYVSQINEEALAAVSLAFPIQNLMIAIGAGTAVGINALLSRNLGAKDFEGVNKAANNGILLGILNGVAFVAVGLLLSRPFFELQTTDTVILEYGISYMQIVTIFSLGLFGQFVMERLLQATGRTVYSMISQGVGAIANIILDPIFIFGWFGLPAMGVAGAAIATVIGQFLGMFVGLFFNLTRNPEVKLMVKEIRPHAPTIKKIYAVGLPSIIMQSIGSVMVFGLNKILMGFTSTATAMFGVYFKLQSFVFMPVFGLNAGLVPIISYNFGARNKDRMQHAIKLGIRYAMGIMFIGFLVFQLAPGQLLSIFNTTDAALAIGIPMLRIISINFLVAGFNVVCGTAFQAVGKGTYSMYISLARQLAVLLPAAYLLSLLGNVDYVWFSFTIAEVACLAMSFLFLRHTKRTIIDKIEPLDTGADMTEPFEQQIDEAYESVLEAADDLAEATPGHSLGNSAE